MEKSDIAWPQYVIYILVMLFVFFASTSNAQITATHFNAEWNNANGCKWFMNLKDCKTLGTVDIGKNPKEAKKYKIAVVPTIIIFKDGEEVARFQANIMMQLETPKKEVQEAIDEILMEDF